MVSQVKRYKCDICKNLFDDFSEALKCEGLGIPPQRFHKGDSIVFENEESTFGSRYSYSSAQGTVLFAYILGCEVNNVHKHQWFYIVQLTHYECVVTEVLGELGIKLTSLAEWKYKTGYAAEYEQYRQKY